MAMHAYKITNTVNGRAYIGISIRPIGERYRRHLLAAEKGVRSPLYRAMRKHGIEAFHFEVLAEACSLRELYMIERGLIAEHGTFAKSGGGYNQTMGGEGSHGLKHNAESRKKIAALSRQKMLDPEFKERINAGRKRWSADPENKKKASEHARKTLRSAASLEKNPALVRGRKLSAEHRAKISAAQKGIAQPPGFSERMSKIHKGKIVSEETRALQSKNQRERFQKYGVSEATRAKQSAAHKGRPKTEEHRRKLSIAARLRHQRKQQQVAA